MLFILLHCPSGQSLLFMALRTGLGIAMSPRGEDGINVESTTVLKVILVSDRLI